MSSESEVATKRRSFTRLILAVIALVVLVVLFTKIGLYTVQPIGAIPEGRTLVIWRNSGEPFFNSPDALCLERLGGVSLLCRGIAINEAPLDRIILRLPYQEWAYLRSTGGMEFDR